MFSREVCEVSKNTFFQSTSGGLLLTCKKKKLWKKSNYIKKLEKSVFENCDIVADLDVLAEKVNNTIKTQTKALCRIFSDG